MQRYALTVDKFLDHAAKWHGTSHVLSADGDGEADRITYRQLHARCRLVSGAMLDRGLRPGDRVATLAWNTEDHLTLYYAAMGVGLVCHTLNPRLSVAHLAEMVNEAQDRWIAVGCGLQSLAGELLAACPGLETVILLDGQAPQQDVQGRDRKSVV